MSAVGTLDLRVADVRSVTPDVVELRLQRADGGPLPEWTPGAHVSLRLAPGLDRQYSLCGDPADRTSWRVAVLRAPQGRGGSVFVHERLHAGSMVSVEGPRNHFPLVDAPHYLFLAGGIGITPMMPMIAAVERAGATWSLHYGGRTRETMAYAAELSEYGDRVRLWPEAETGPLDLLKLTNAASPETLIYACGPEGMLNALTGLAGQWPKDRLHLERFSAATVDASAVNKPFTLHLAASGRSIQVEADESILDAMAREGMQPRSSCMEGTCGTCETRVLRGAIDHRCAVLSDSERESGEFMMICVSRALGDELELDA